MIRKRVWEDRKIYIERNGSLNTFIFYNLDSLKKVLKYPKKKKKKNNCKETTRELGSRVLGPTRSFSMRSYLCVFTKIFIDKED